MEKIARKRLNTKPFKKQTLAEQVSDSIAEAIVSGAWKGGEALPTEPEIAAQYGVSRAVVRDATRMLAAKGLVEAQHGKGVFVTHSPTEAFGDALLLALRRMDATVWDVTQYERMLYPEMVALAAENANSADLAQIRQTIDQYLSTLHTLDIPAQDMGAESVVMETLIARWADIIQAIGNATHNKLYALLARPLNRLHSFRHWIGAEEEAVTMDTDFLNTMYESIATGDPSAARARMSTITQMPQEAITAMRQTPIGEVTHITLKS